MFYSYDLKNDKKHSKSSNDTNGSQLNNISNIYYFLLRAIFIAIL